MENKYYTPSIEEFHVGFEYEISMQSHAMSILDTTKNEIKQLTPYVKSWEKTEVFFDTSYGFKNKLFRNIEQLKEILDNGNIRVKYLDKEDIESLGWKFLYTKTIKTINGNKTDVLDFIFTVNDRLKYELRCKVEDTTRVIITVPSEIFSIPLTIKNKSELKRLMQQLGIS